MMFYRYTIRLEEFTMMTIKQAEDICKNKLIQEETKQCCCTHFLIDHKITTQWFHEPEQKGLSETCEARVNGCLKWACPCPGFETDNLEYLLLLKKKRGSGIQSPPFGV